MDKIALIGNYKSSYKIYSLLQFKYSEIYFINDSKLLNENIPIISIEELINQIESFTCFFLSLKDKDEIKYYLDIIPDKKIICIDKYLINNSKAAIDLISIIENKKYNLVININRMYDIEYVNAFNNSIDKEKKIQIIDIYKGNQLKIQQWLYNIIPFLIIRNEKIINITKINENNILINTNKILYKINLYNCGDNAETHIFVNNNKLPEPNFYLAVNNYLNLKMFSQNLLKKLLISIGKSLEVLYDKE